MLDFEAATGQVNLASASSNVTLPASAERIGQLDGVRVLYIDLNTVDTDRVRSAEVEAAANSIEAAIGDDMLLVVVNKSGTQLHIIHPDFSGARLVLRRMVVGRDVPFRTVVQQVSNIYETYLKSGNLRAVLSKAFDVEEVTDKFFKKYHEIFDDALKSITGFGSGDDDDDAKRLFVQTLFNRLMFVHFLSRKGWLSINDDKDYLRALWIDYRNTSAPSPTGIAPNFYRDRLRLLFFTGLNNPDSRDLSRGASHRIGSVPFLNGGLFTEGEHDGVDSPIVVPDSVIEQGLEELFEKFNFTVMESTPFDIEVAVDPEMLGKVFEELVNERHDSGAYYTPRPVVAFMCREALKGYLEGKDTGVSADAIAGYIENRDTGGISVDAARRIGAALDEITVVDPACGSGAFLLGMMQELVDLQTTLYNAGVDSRSLHALKLHIIERNLYGVDIDELAVNIAMLRLWLSLAIDFDGDTPPALPNLDFKIVHGDSLLGPDPSPDKYPDLFRYQVVQAADRIAKLKAEFMNTSDRFLKAERQDEIEAVERELTAALSESPAPEGAVDWRVQFAEVFALRGGFDVAIANPPYGISIKDRRSIVIGHADSYTNFMGLSTELAPNGVMAYITPTSWETGERFKKFRRYLFVKMALRDVVNLPYDVFATPYVDTSITIGLIGRPSPTTFRLATFEKRAGLDLTHIVDLLSLTDWSVVAGDPELRVPLLAWAVSLFGRVGTKATPLGHMTSSKRGIAEYKYNILSSPTRNAIPFFDGQVQRYEVSAPSKHSFVVIGDSEIRFHRGLRILARRLVSRANRLSFAITGEELVVKEAILPIKPNFSDPKRLAALLAILNSSLMSFLYLSRSTAAVKDDFRQVTLSGLRELPIIFPNETQMTALSKLVSARENGNGDIEDFERRIDAIIYNTYEVTEAETEQISAWLARSG